MRRISGRRAIGIAAGVLVALSAAVLSPWVRATRAPDHVRDVPILAGSPQGVYYQYAVGLAAAINYRLQGVRATAVVTAASVANLRGVAGAPDVFAFTAADAASAAQAGSPPSPPRYACGRWPGSTTTTCTWWSWAPRRSGR